MLWRVRSGLWKTPAPTAKACGTHATSSSLAGCHAHGFAWACERHDHGQEEAASEANPMPTQSRGHGTRRMNFGRVDQSLSKPRTEAPFARAPSRGLATASHHFPKAFPAPATRGPARRSAYICEGPCPLRVHFKLQAAECHAHGSAWAWRGGHRHSIPSCRMAFSMIERFSGGQGWTRPEGSRRFHACRVVF